MCEVQNYQLLGNAIVKQAARDYERCLVENYLNGSPLTKGRLMEVENYFRGELIKSHTKLDGVRLMNRIKEQVIEYNYDLKALNKARHVNSGYYDED